MTEIFSFDFMVMFGFLSVMLILGVILRAKVPFIQKYLFPSCLIGGLLGMVATNLKLLPITTNDIESLAYHLFNISFISVGLTRDDNNPRGSKPNISALKGPLWMALIQSLTFPLQAIVGGISVLLLGALGIKLFSTFGFLLPLGFNEGPGQALSFGKVWESMGFENGATIGLTFGAIGFFFSFFVGVPLAYWGIKRGLAVNQPRTLSKELLTGIVQDEVKRENAGKLALHTSNIDSLAFQSAIVVIVYWVTYMLVKNLSLLLGGNTGKMLWGFFFIIGLAVAILARRFMELLKVDYLIDAGIQRRITGWAVDFLIVSAVSAIKLPAVWKYFVPIISMSLVGGGLTTLVVVFFGRRLDDYNLERLLSIYGVVTGTTSTGLLLLRIVDPEFKTPVAMELALMNIFAIPIIFSCLLIVNAPLHHHWNIVLTLLFFAIIFLSGLILLKLLRLWKAPKF